MTLIKQLFGCFIKVYYLALTYYKNNKIQNIMNKFQLPDLPYPYEALEPYFDQHTMHIYHQRHHQAYVDNLNKAIAGTAADDAELEDEHKSGA